MGCCGKNRITPSTPVLPAPKERPPQPVSFTVSFQYIGEKRLTVRGGTSRRLYRFPAPNAIVEVRACDADSLMRVPLLRRI